MTRSPRSRQIGTGTARRTRIVVIRIAVRRTRTEAIRTGIVRRTKVVTKTRIVRRTGTGGTRTRTAIGIVEVVVAASSATAAAAVSAKLQIVSQSDPAGVVAAVTGADLAVPGTPGAGDRAALAMLANDRAVPEPRVAIREAKAGPAEDRRLHPRKRRLWK